MAILDEAQKVQLTKDLSLRINFAKKTIEVVSDNWTTIVTITRENEKQEAGGGGGETPSSTTPKVNKTVAQILSENIGKNIIGGAGETTKYDPNKKVQLSNEEKILEKFIQVFDGLAEVSFNEHAVHYKTLEKSLQSQQITKNYYEFNKFLNMALELNIIESVEEQHLKGFYRRKQ